MQKINFFLLLFTFIFIQFNCTNKKKSIPNNWQEINKKGYSIAFPNNWILDTVNTYNSTLFLYCPESLADTIFRTNINLIIQENIPNTLTYEAAIASTESEIRKAVVVDDFKTKISEQYCSLEYSGMLDSKHLAWQQRLWIKNKKLYVLTLTAPKNLINQFTLVNDSINQYFTIQ